MALYLQDIDLWHCLERMKEVNKLQREIDYYKWMLENVFIPNKLNCKGMEKLIKETKEKIILIF